MLDMPMKKYSIRGGALFWLLFIIYRAALDLWFIEVISKIFVEYRDVTFDMGRIYQSLTLFLIAGFVFPKRWDKASSVYYAIFLVAIVVPMSTLYAYNDYSSQYLFSVIISIILMKIILQFKVIRIPYLVNSENLVFVFLLVSLMSSVLWLLYSTGGRFVIDFSDIYKYRIENREVVSSWLWGYLISWSGKVIVPFFIALSLYKKRKDWLLLFIGLQFCIFSLSTHKLYIVLGMFPVFAYKFMAREKINSNAMLFLLCGSLLFLFLFYAITKNVWIPALTVQRAILKPAYLNFVYAEFFSDKAPLLFSNSLLSNFQNMGGSVSPGFMIGEYLKGGDETRSNTGFLGTSVAQLGLVGPPIFGVVVAIILRFIDSIGRSYPLWFVLSVTFGGVSSMLISADLLPSLNTHGILLSLLILLLLRRSFYHSNSAAISNER